MSSESNKGQYAYRFALAFLWQMYKRFVGLPIISKLDNGAQFILHPHSTNSAGNIYVKTYEAEYIYFLRKHLGHGGLILDVGAHMGLYTLLLNEKFDGGYCFEPAADTFKYLEKNIYLNDYAQKFKSINKAVSDRYTKARLIQDGQFSGTNKIETGPQVNPGEEMETVSIDVFLQEASERRQVSFIKIDTEGHEYNVLLGAKETLTNNAGCLVLLENSDTELVCNLFEQIGYKMFSIDKKGSIKTVPSDLKNAGNIFAVGPKHSLHTQV